MRHPSRYMITSNASRDDDHQVFASLGSPGTSLRDMVFRVATTHIQASQALQSLDRDGTEPNALVRMHSLLAREGPQPLFSQPHTLGMPHFQARDDPANAAEFQTMVPWETDRARYDGSRPQSRPSTRRGRSDHSMGQSSLQYGSLRICSLVLRAVSCPSARSLVPKFTALLQTGC